MYERVARDTGGVDTHHLNEGRKFAKVKLGDAFYFGHADKVVNHRKAAAAYREAKDGQTIAAARACFNLGYMHLVGQGVAKDDHQADVYFQQAAGSYRERGAWLVSQQPVN